MRLHPPELAPTLILVGAAAFPVQADTVYRCLQNGIVTYTESATHPSCQPMDVTPYEPDPDAVAQQKETLKKWRDARSETFNERRRKKAEDRPVEAEPTTLPAAPPEPPVTTPLLPGAPANPTPPEPAR